MDKTLPLGVSIVDSSEATGLLPNLPLNVGFLGQAKRGDFVRLLVKFTTPAIPPVPAGPNNKTTVDSEGKITESQPAVPGVPANPRATELITAVVASKTPALLKVKVYSRPRMTQYHSITYGDDLTLSERYIITHEQSTPAQAQEVEHVLTGVIPEPQPINPEDAKLRAAIRNLPPLQPEMGRQYWLRNGTLVTAWAFHAGVWVGGGSDSATLEWTATGAHAGGNRELDIVKDPRASEVVK